MSEYNSIAKETHLSQYWSSMGRTNLFEFTILNQITRCIIWSVKLTSSYIYVLLCVAAFSIALKNSCIKSIKRKRFTGD